MTTRLISAATAVMAFALLIAGNAWAQDFDPCAGLTGKAKGLCTEYSAGMGCSSDVPHATPKACANVATMLEEITGFPPPSDCPCNFSLARIRDTVDGWDSAAPYQCKQIENFDRTLPPPDSHGGSDRTMLWADKPHHFGEIGPNVNTEVNAGDTVVQFRCRYGSANYTNLQKVFFEGGRGRGYADDVKEYIDNYEACKGAIGILVANFPFDLPINRCLFD